jgi:hypothetical protein
MSIVVTQDGTCIIIDPDVGEVCAPTREAAEAEVRRRRAYRNVRSDGGGDVFTRQTAIQSGAA